MDGIIDDYNVVRQNLKEHKCPDCGNMLNDGGGCMFCPCCGFSKC